jgi:outer membrane protein OmpA-like peptidoglycan-associated protein
MTLTEGYKKYVEYDPEAKLSIVAHTDPRGNKMSNQGLAARRADSVRQFLVAQGIPMEKIDTSAVGEEQPLDDQTITALESQNPNPLPQKRADDQKTTNLAYQRRVDIVFLPSNAESKRFYPNSAPDSDLLWQRPKPNLSEIQTQE